MTVIWSFSVHFSTNSTPLMPPSAAQCLAECLPSAIMKSPVLSSNWPKNGTVRQHSPGTRQALGGHSADTRWIYLVGTRWDWWCSGIELPKKWHGWVCCKVDINFKSFLAEKKRSPTNTQPIQTPAVYKHTDHGLEINKQTNRQRCYQTYYVHAMQSINFSSITNSPKWMPNIVSNSNIFIITI